MKQLLFGLILFLLPVFTFGQYFSGGIVAGIDAGQIDGDTQGGYKKLGFIAGAFVDYKISDKSFIEANFYYIGKGAVYNIKNERGVIIEQVFNNSLHYIEIPVRYSYRFMKQFSVAAGIAPAYLFADKLVLFGNEISKDTYQMSNIDLGASIHVEFYFPKKFSIELGITRSVISIRKDYFWLNNNLSIVGKYRF